MPVVPMSKEGKRITIPVTEEEHLALFNLAKRSRTSVSSLGHLAISQLLLTAKKGALPLLPPSTLESAQEVTCLGNPIVR